MYFSKLIKSTSQHRTDTYTWSRKFLLWDHEKKIDVPLAWGDFVTVVVGVSEILDGVLKTVQIPNGSNANNFVLCVFRIRVTLKK